MPGLKARNSRSIKRLAPGHTKTFEVSNRAAVGFATAGVKPKLAW